jgi:uncharacterized protein YjbI with pentapeptide repeats
MANPKHLAKLKEGVEAWNTWRLGNMYIMPDLRWADLSDVDLSKADLRWADLRSVDLRMASLKKANLIGVDLRRASLEKANLVAANLTGANLSGTDLQEARLFGADLGGVNLRSANLNRADLRRVRNVTVKQLSKEVKLNGAELDPDLMEKLYRLYPHLRMTLKTNKRKGFTQRCPHCTGATK